MDDKKRKGAIVVAAILGLVAALYLAGLLAQVLNNYSIWMDGGGLTGQTQMPPVEFSPMICFPQAFTWNGLKGVARYDSCQCNHIRICKAERPVWQ